MNTRFFTTTALSLSIAAALTTGMVCVAPAQATPSGADLSALSVNVDSGKTRTTNGFSHGQCTWLAQERFKQQHGHYMNIYGDAHTWDEAAKRAGWNVRTDRPFQHSVLVFERGVAFADPTYGHVAWVTSAGKNSKGQWQMHIEEMNWGGQVGPTKRYAVQWVKGMSVITNQ